MVGEEIVYDFEVKRKLYRELEEKAPLLTERFADEVVFTEGLYNKDDNSLEVGLQDGNYLFLFKRTLTVTKSVGLLVELDINATSPTDYAFLIDREIYKNNGDVFMGFVNSLGYKLYEPNRVSDLNEGELKAGDSVFYKDYTVHSGLYKVVDGKISLRLSNAYDGFSLYKVFSTQDIRVSLINKQEEITAYQDVTKPEYLNILYTGTTPMRANFAPSETFNVGGIKNSGGYTKKMNITIFIKVSVVNNDRGGAVDIAERLHEQIRRIVGGQLYFNELTASHEFINNSYVLHSCDYECIIKNKYSLAAEAELEELNGVNVNIN